MCICTEGVRLNYKTDSIDRFSFTLTRNCNADVSKTGVMSACLRTSCDLIDLPQAESHTCRRAGITSGARYDKGRFTIHGERTSRNTMG